MIEQRKDRIAKDIDDATAMQQKADAAAAAHEKALADARARAQASPRRRATRLAAEADAKRKAVDEELAAKFAEAERQIAATRDTGDGQCRRHRPRGDGRDRRALDRPSGQARGDRRRGRTRRRPAERRRMMFGAEFFVLIGFIVFLCLLGYVGAYRMLLGGLDKRGKAIADELDAGRQAARRSDRAARELREEEARGRGQRGGDRRRSARPGRGQLAKEAAERMEDFVARRSKQAEAKIALAESQAAAEVRAAAADFAAKAAEIVLRQETQGAAGAELAAREIAALKDRLN